MKKLQEIERELILAALERNNFNKCATARELGCSPGTIRNKLKSYQLTTREVVVPTSSGVSETDFVAFQRDPEKKSRLRG